MKTLSIVFVCYGNICRSPAAENIFRHQVRQAGLEHHIHIDSAGTDTCFAGKAPDQRMARALARRGIPSEGTARAFRTGDFDHFDLILAMDRENHARLGQLAATPALMRKVVMFGSFCEHPDHRDGEVPDPYYGGEDGFEKVAEMLQDGCRQLLEHVRQRLAQ